MEDKKYAILGMHGADVDTVNKIVNTVDEAGNPVQLVEQRNVVRVRMFVGEQVIDEDFTMPSTITVEEQIDSAVTARISEIESQGSDPKLSKIVPEQTEQLIMANKKVEAKK